MLTNLVFSTTYKCNAACKYCGAQCGPDRTERLSYEEMRKIIDQVSAYGRLQLVVFTGGEPFLLGRDLFRSVQHCAAQGIFTRIVSNGFWAKTYDIAYEMMSRYKEAGLGEMNLSCDDYHQEFIPIECVKNANKACLDLGIPCLIGHRVMKDYKMTVESLEKALGEKMTMYEPGGNNPKNNIVSTGYTVPVTQDMHLIPEEEILYPPDGWHWMKACSSVLQRIVVTPDRKLSICCGMIPRSVEEVFFGSLDEANLEELILEANQDLIANWLALEGPYGMMKFIQGRAPGIRFRERYVNTCHLCSEILTRTDCRDVLRRYGEEKRDELMMQRVLYDQLRLHGKLYFDHDLQSAAQ